MSEAGAGVQTPVPDKTPDQLRGASLPRRLADIVSGPVTVSVVLSIVIGAVFIAVAGHNPLTAFPSMISGSLTGRGLTDTLSRAIPIVGMALAIALAFRAGVFNLGTEGQLVLGALAGTMVALTVPGPGFLVMVLACAAAVVAGGLWALLSAVLQTRMGVPILISSLLLNYPARYLTDYLVRFPLRDKASSMVATKAVRDTVKIPGLVPARSGLGRWMASTLGSDNVLVLIGRNIDWSLPVVVAMVVAIVVFNNRTASGYEAGMTGLNFRFARYGGVDTNRMTLRVMFTSGGMAGLIGVMLVLGSQYRVISGALVGTNYAWTGLLVALLAASRPLGVLIAGCFFAVLVVGGEAMQRAAGVSSQIAQVIQATVIVLLTFRVRLARRRRKSDDTLEVTPLAEADAEVGRV